MRRWCSAASAAQSDRLFLGRFPLYFLSGGCVAEGCPDARPFSRAQPRNLYRKKSEAGDRLISSDASVAERPHRVGGKGGGRRWECLLGRNLGDELTERPVLLPTNEAGAAPRRCRWRQEAEVWRPAAAAGLGRGR